MLTLQKYGMLSVTIIPTRKCYLNMLTLQKGHWSCWSCRIRPPTKTYPPENHIYPKVKQRKYTHAQKSLPSRKSYLRTHKNRPSRKSYLCTNRPSRKQYQIHNLQNITLPPPSLATPSQKEGVVLCASVGVTNQIVDFWKTVIVHPVIS